MTRNCLTYTIQNSNLSNTLVISIFLNVVYYIPIYIKKNMNTVMNRIVIDDNINENNFGKIWLFGENKKMKYGEISKNCLREMHAIIYRRI